MSVRSIALAAAACAAATLSTTVPTPAAATDVIVVPATVTVRVSFADLNLASAAGRAVLDRRIASAARSICGTYFARDLQMQTLVQNCREDAIASARLSAAYAGARDLTVTGNRMSRAAN